MAGKIHEKMKVFFYSCGLLLFAGLLSVSIMAPQFVGKCLYYGGVVFLVVAMLVCLSYFFAALTAKEPEKRKPRKR